MKKTLFVTENGRIVQNGVRYSTTMYAEFLDMLDDYVQDYNGYFPTVRKYATMCRISIGLAKKIIDFAKNKREIITKNIEKKNRTNYRSHSLTLVD